MNELGEVQKVGGIVEVCDVDGQWNLLCADDPIGDGVAHAVCKQKGYVGATKDENNRQKYLL